MKSKFRGLFHIGRRFKNELRREIRTLILFTLGFTIAFAWRQTTFDLSLAFIKFLTNIEDTNTSSILTSVFITLLAIVLIYFISYTLRDSPENY